MAARVAIALVAAGLAGGFAAAGAAAGPFTLHSSSFRDGARLAAKHAGKSEAGPNCFGENVAPALSWSDLPAGTRSIALIVYDPEGRRGLGVSHMVAYGIAPDASFAEGELSMPSTKTVAGRNMGGGRVYAGPCPPPGTADHHYVFTAIATDLAPDALPPGLSREELFARLEGGHAKSASSLVGLSIHP
jgi:Raf kinase inhibitor-like YbhB/YbcL family protein